MIFIGIALIIIVVWWLAKNSNKTEIISIPSQTVEDITEETIFEVQSRLETKLEVEANFPDAIMGYRVYCYKYLMLPWYKNLSSKNRYNEERIRQIRRDWLDYISSLENSATWSYLSMEYFQEDNEKSESYDNKSSMARRKMVAIEDGFAAAVGDDALKQLKQFRIMCDKNFRKFGKFGDIAPEGFEYDPMGDLRMERN